MMTHLEVVRVHMERYRVLEMLDQKDINFLTDVERISEIYRKKGHYEKEASILMGILRA